MNDSGQQPASGVALEANVAALVRTVRRQTIAIWILVGVLALSYGAPWVTYLLYRAKAAEPSASLSPTGEVEQPEAEVPFDNDFHARPVEEKVRRATAILLTRPEKVGDEHRQVVSEIIKLKPGVRLYYKVGDEYERLSRSEAPSCRECEEQRQIVFMLGNPATMAYSATFEGERLLGMGHIAIDELRRLAAASLDEERK